MIHFVQSVAGVDELFRQYALVTGAAVKNGRLDIPPKIGKGYLQLEHLPNGLKVLILNFTTHDDFYYERPSSNKNIYTLRSRETDVSSKLAITIDDETASESAGKHKSLFLTSHLFDLSYFVSKNSHVAAIHIELNKEWMAKYLHMNVYEDILNEYLSLKIKMLDAVIMDADYTAAHQEILTIDKTHPAEVTILHNRIMYIIERFFRELYEQRQQIKYRLRNNPADIDAVVEVESKLSSRFDQPFPSIAQLAKEAGMSASKLKMLFKKIYGKAMYEHYQERRMIKAKAMLLSGDSVKEAAMELGFKNISNFSIAFKKQFGNQPHEFTKRGK